MKIQKTTSQLLPVALLISSLVVIGTQPARATVDIPTDTSVGTWDPVDRVFTLTQDLTEGIRIVDDYLTLDGAGHVLSGFGGYGIGVFVRESFGVTITNLNIQDFATAIRLWNCDQCTLINNIASNNLEGIYIQDSIQNALMANTLANNYNGIHLNRSNESTLAANTISSNTNVGILIDESCNTWIYQNNFIENATQAYVNGGTDNIFNHVAPYAGNYWSDWTSPDSDGDGIVDLPYAFAGGHDNLPWTEPDGWLIKTPQEQLVNLVGEVLSLNLHQGINNSLDAKLDAAMKALDDLNSKNDISAVNSLQAFINAVEAQRGKEITESDADALIAAAQEIIDDLNL